MENTKMEQVDATQVETMEQASGTGSPYRPDEVDEEITTVTFKAWLSIVFLSLTFGVPFWATPVTASTSAQIFAEFGGSELSFWVIPIITTTAAVTILIFGCNSDLFGRRTFVLMSCVICAVGYAICAEAKSINMLIGGLVLNGVASGVSGIALIAVPELLPNKWRHIGVVIADAVVYVFIIIGPVVGRFAVQAGGGRWRYLYWGGFAAAILTGIGLVLCYFPPKHPRGVAWNEALRGLDYVGAVLYTIGSVLVLVGIVYTTYISSTNTKVLVCLCVGFLFIVAFGLWETFSNVKFPLCPPSIFRSHNGREFTVPFCLAFIIVGTFYGTSVIYPTLLDVFYIDAETSISESLLLTLPNSIPLVTGAILLSLFGGKVGHWKWTMTISMTTLTLFLSLMALVTPYNKAMMISFTALVQLSYGWAAYLSVTYTQLGVPQEMLGISGGLAGTARYAGGAVASACYSAAYANGLASKAPEYVARAATDAGVPRDIYEGVVAAASAGPAGLAAFPELTKTMVAELTEAYRYAAAFGLRNSALAAMAFGVVGIVLCLFLEDLEPKMTPKIEVFLENDRHASKNKFH